MSTGTSCHFGHLLQVSKQISLRSDFISFFSYFIHVHSCRSGADNPRGQNFDVNRNLMSLCSFATNFKKISLKSDFIHFFFMILYMYIVLGQGLTTPWGWNFSVNRNILSLRSFVANLKKISLKSDFIQFFSWFYTCIAPGQRQTSPRGQCFDVNRNVLSLHSFVASFKNMSLKSDFIPFLYDLRYVYSTGVGGRQPPGDKILMSTERPYPFTHLLQVSKIQFFFMI